MIQRVFQWILVVLGVLNNILKIYLPESRHFQDGVRVDCGELKMAISQMKKKTIANILSTDSGTSGHSLEHTKNRGKYSFRKGFIFKMAREWRPRWLQEL